MIVDFTVENYRSIKERVTLTAVAQKQSDRQTSQSSKRKRVKSDRKMHLDIMLKGGTLM
jgi:uncharacterized protein